MEAHYHLIVGIMGCIGLMMGTFLIDLDHSGSIKDKWQCFTHPKECVSGHPDLKRGFFHESIIAYSIIALCLFFAFGYIIHIMMDGVFLF